MVNLMQQVVFRLSFSSQIVINFPFLIFVCITGGSVEAVRGVTERPASKPKEFDASEGRWRGKHRSPQDLQPVRRGLTRTGRDGGDRLL